MPKWPNGQKHLTGVKWTFWGAFPRGIEKTNSHPERVPAISQGPSKISWNMEECDHWPHFRNEFSYLDQIAKNQRNWFFLANRKERFVPFRQEWIVNNQITSIGLPIFMNEMKGVQCVHINLFIQIKGNEGKCLDWKTPWLRQLT